MSRAKNSHPDPTTRRTATVQRVDADYGIPPRTAYKLLKAGKLQSTKVGRRRLIFVDSVEKLLRAGA